jgi:hypothetical protein
MDYGYKFEKLINSYIGTPDYVTYATYWSSDNCRKALLYTACLKKYDGNSTGEIGEKLMYFMENIFNSEDVKKQISIECLNYLSDLK